MRKLAIEQQLQNKIMILDGAMGTMIQQASLTADDFGGEELRGCNEILVLTRPDLIASIHEAYLEAGADILETNTFGSTSVVLAEYDIPEIARELNLAAAKLALNAINKYSTPEWPRYVAGALGSTAEALFATGGVTFEQLIDSYHEQALALMDAGVDALLLEISRDTLNVQAGSIGISRAFESLGRKLPIMISVTIESMGTTLAGQSIEAFYISLEHLNPISIGLNCASGPAFMHDHIRTLSQVSKASISCYPNAGLSDENGPYNESPESLATKLCGFAEQGWINIVGGSCGATPLHIRALAERMKSYNPRRELGNHPPAG